MSIVPASAERRAYQGERSSDLHEMQCGHPAGPSKSMTPRRHIILAATILIVLWSGAAVAHWAFFDSHDLLASAHAALTHLLGSAVGTPASGRHMVWSTVVLALGFVARVYGFSVIALFAVKPYIDRRVREAYAYARISTGGDPISTSIRGRSAMN